MALSLNSACLRFSFNSAVKENKLSRSRGLNGDSLGAGQPRNVIDVADLSRTRKWFVATVSVSLN